MAATILYMPTIPTFVERYGIRMTAERVSNSPTFLDDAPEDAMHFRCKLTREGKEMPVFFTMTPEHGEEPDIVLVLTALANEAEIYETHGESIALENEKVFTALASGARRLQEFLGDEAYGELVWSISR